MSTKNTPPAPDAVPTPRTDKEHYTVETAANYGMGDEYDHHVVDVEFARTLEREAVRLLAERNDLEAEVRSMQRRLSNDTQALRQLRKERDDAIDQRDTYRANMEAADKACMNALAQLAEHEQSRADYIRDAIAEVKDRVREAVTTALND